MRILAVGGGSGGHVTPVVAVLKELRQRNPEVELRFWCDKRFAKQAKSILSSFDDTIPMHTITAGKLRRYHHLTFWQHITWPSLMFKNIADMILVAVGVVQSFFKLLFWRPDVIFTKGGYVCLPVGVAARALGIPIVVHDSDAHPGLTNRILAKWANSIATGAPLSYYSYPKSKSHYVGIPIDPRFKPASVEEQIAAKKEWGVDENKPLLVATGGGLGAKRINDAVIHVLSKLQQSSSVILVAGAGQYDELRPLVPENTKNFQIYPFISNMHSLLTAADIVVARAGATTILELVATAKPTILVPNAKLTGGHQVKNAKVYADARAVVTIDENEMDKDPTLLVEAVQGLLDDPSGTKDMAERFAAFAKPDAAKDVAILIEEAIKR